MLIINYLNCIRYIVNKVNQLSLSSFPMSPSPLHRSPFTSSHISFHLSTRPLPSPHVSFPFSIHPLSPLHTSPFTSPDVSFDLSIYFPSTLSIPNFPIHITWTLCFTHLILHPSSPYPIHPPIYIPLNILLSNEYSLMYLKSTYKEADIDFSFAILSNRKLRFIPIEILYRSSNNVGSYG